jgi:hypothetical protein
MARNMRCFLTGLLVTTLCALSVRADLFISAPTLTVTPGSVGHFGVLLTNTGPQSSFTDARPCTNAFQHPLPTYCSGEPPYIFAETSAT